MKTTIGCSAVILNEQENRVLISQRSNKKKSFPGYWETIGGSLENDESPEECIMRELEEELYLSGITLKQHKTYILYESNVRYVLINFIGKYQNVVSFNEEEIKKLCWVTREEIDLFQFCPGCKEKILDVFNSRSVYG